MNGFLVVALLLVPASSALLAHPSDSPPLKEATPTTAIDEAFKKLSLPCPDRSHINDAGFGQDGSRFMYRPHDMYDDCADEMDLLAKTRESVDDRLLRLGNEGKELPERYRAAWILIQRRNAQAVPILEKMAAAPSAEERYLAWHAYREAIWERQLPIPQSFDAALNLCRQEKNRYVQREAMNFLGACKAKEAVPLLTVLVADDPSCYDAVHALGEIGDPSAVPTILASARKEKVNRHIYFHALGRLGTPEAVDYLIEHLNEGCFAIEALFESRSPKALPVLEKHLDQLKKMKGPDELNLAVAETSVLQLKYKDPREQLMRLAEDRKQSRWMRTHALEALGNHDKRPFIDRILNLYRTDTNDSMRMFYIRLLKDQPGKDVTDAMIDQALTDNKNKYYHSHDDLLQALNQRLNTTYRKMTPLVEYLQRERADKERQAQ